MPTRTNDDVERPSETIGSLDLLVTEYVSAVDKIRGYGVRVSGASRLREFQRQLRAVVQQGSSRDLALIPLETARQALISSREATEITRIVEALPALPSDSMLSRLRLLAGDHPDPNRGSETPGRDAQYELFLYAELRRAGLQVEFSEPDLRLSLSSGEVAMEAKRPKNTKQLVKRARDAANQLNAVKGVRILALSMDLVLAPKILPRGSTPKAIREEALRRLVEWDRLEGQRLASATRTGNIDAILFTCAMPAIEMRAVTWVQLLNFSTSPQAVPAITDAINEIKNAIGSQAGMTVA